ncbi:MAG TPA: hypothetical protein DCQ98_01765 [Planctomycetaceae bacterium]|nr:hypothetical protein [Planctomycetaceae bacterium]HRF01636.1 transglutaminase-like domain-containing protein [Pirellulaceae bacterium]
MSSPDGKPANRSGSERWRARRASVDATSRSAAGSGPFLLALIAAGALFGVRMGAAWSPALTLAEAGVMLVALLLFRRYEPALSARFGANRTMLAAMGIAAVGSWIATTAAERLTGQGEAFELLMLTWMQQIVLVAAAVRSNRLTPERSVLGSGFLIVFVTAAASDRRIIALTLLYVVLAVGWLMGEYWRRIAPGLAADRVDRRPPRRLAILALLIALLPLFWWAAPRSVWSTLHGFMPTSGGDRWGDDAARGGVGNGDLLVGARESASTFGPVDTDVFLESTEPSLYDMFSDLYGKPKPPKRNERAVAINPEAFQENHRKLPSSSEAGQGFSTARTGRRPEKPLESDDPRDILQVVGDVPIHLALERFDRFDGTEWRHAERDSSLPAPTAQQVGPLATTWFRGTDFRTPNWLVPGRSHGLRIFRLGSPRLPMPPHPQGWHIDKVDRPDFYATTDDGQWSLAGRETIPPATVVDLVSGGHRPTMLASTSFALRASRPPSTDPFATDADRPNDDAPGDVAPTDDVPAEGDASDELASFDRPIPAEIAQLARHWTSGHEPGWSQISALVERLRGEGTLDPAVVVPDDADDSVLWFLESRRGPDFLFASAAVQLLRALEYDARLVTGFYADPKRYDRRAGTTAIRADDVHVWCEVRTASGEWVPLEPTPGYVDTAVAYTWGDRLRLAALALIGFIVRWWPAAILVPPIGFVAWRSRYRFLDRWAKLAARGGMYGVDARLADRALRLLERRAVAADERRPVGAPPIRWHRDRCRRLESLARRSIDPSHASCSTETPRSIADAAGWDALQRALYRRETRPSDDESAALRVLIRQVIALPRRRSTDGNDEARDRETSRPSSTNERDSSPSDLASPAPAETKTAAVDAPPTTHRHLVPTFSSSAVLSPPERPVA